MVSTKSIEVFLALVEHKSIAAVARLTYFSQPTISEYLHQLEKTVGAKLILRGKGQRQITLTPAGEAFLPLARQWMENQKNLEEQIARFSHKQNKQTLRLAASAGAHQRVVSEIVCKLMERHPGVSLQLSNVERREVHSAAEMFAFDIAVTFGNLSESDLTRVIPAFEEEQYILCRADTQLPDRMLTPEDLDPSKEVVYAVHRNNKEYLQWRRTCFPGEELSEKEQDLVVSSLGSIHNYLHDPQAWAVVPASVALSDIAQKMDKLTFRRITPQPPHRICNIILAKTYQDKEVIREFLRCCEAVIDERTYMHRHFVTEDILDSLQ